MADKRIIGSLIFTFLLLSGVIYVQYDDVKFRVDEDQTTLYVKDGSWWNVYAREQNRLFDGSSLMYRDVSETKVDYQELDDSTTIVTRRTVYQRGAVIIDTYTYNTSITDVRFFPIKHTVEVFNGSGYFYRYTVDDIKDLDMKKKVDGLTSIGFGKVKIEFQEGYRWAWIGYPYGSDSFSAQYNVESDYEVFNVRLYDPPVINKKEYVSLISNTDRCYINESCFTVYEVCGVDYPVFVDEANSRFDFRTGDNMVLRSSLEVPVKDLNYYINTSVENENGTLVEGYKMFKPYDKIVTQGECVKIKIEGVKTEKVDLDNVLNLRINNEWFNWSEYAWWNETDNSAENINCSLSFWNDYDNGSSTAKSNLDGYLRNGFFNEDNLIYWFAFENNTKDELCLGDGTNNGATYISNGYLDGAYSLDGNNDYMNFPLTSFPTSISNITITGWFKPDGTLEQSALINTQSSTGLNWINIHLPWSNGDIFWDFGDITSGGRLMTTWNTSWNNIWAYYSFTAESSVGMKIYRNGVLIDSSGSSSTFTKGTQSMNLGYYSPSNGYMNTDVDEFSIYNEALNQTEIEKIYNLTKIDRTRYDNEKNEYFSIINNTGNLINWVIPTINWTGSQPNLSIGINNNSVYINVSNGTNSTITDSQWLSFNFTLGNNTLISNLGLLSGYSSIVVENLTILSTLNNYSRNITAELGSNITIYANISDTIPYTVCIDIDHPEGGINVSCSENETTYYFKPSYFQKTVFNDSDTSKYVNITEVSLQEYFTPIFSSATGSSQNFGVGEKFLAEKDGIISSFELNISRSSGSPIGYVVFLSFDSDGVATILSQQLIDNSGITTFPSYDVVQFNLSNPVKIVKDNYYGVGVYSTTTAAYFLQCDAFSTNDNTIMANGNIANWENLYDAYSCGDGDVLYRINSYNDVVGVSAHHYDEVLNLSFELFSNVVSGEFAKDVKIYINDSLSNDIGLLYDTTNFSLTSFNDSSVSKEVSFSEESVKTIGYVRLPKEATIISSTITFNGSVSYNQDLGLPAKPFVVLNATSISSVADFQINDCNITSFTDTIDNNYTKYVLWSTSGTEEVRRAKILKTLFYGTTGSNPRASNTYITGLTELNTTITRDFNKRVYYFQSLNQYTGLRNVGETDTVVYNVSNAGLSNSLWSYISVRTAGTSGGDSVNSAVYAPSNSIFSSCYRFQNTIDLICDNTGTDQRSKEKDYLIDLKLNIFANDDGGYTTMKTYLLTEGEITLVESEPDWTISTTDFTTDNSIPVFNGWYDTSITNPWFKAGILNGSYDWNITGDLNYTDTTTFDDSLTAFLDSCVADSDGFCEVPLWLYSSDDGELVVQDLEINYTYDINPVYINNTLLQLFLNNSDGFVDIPLRIETSNDANITINNLKYSYRGGNSTVEVLAHSINYSFNETKSITFYYSDWSYSYAEGIDYLEFFPRTSTSKNVTPYGQSNTKPILSVEMENYGGKLGNFSLFTDIIDTCVDFFINSNNTKSDDKISSNLTEIFTVTQENFTSPTSNLLDDLCKFPKQIAQTFIATNTYNITNVGLRLSRYNTSGDPGTFTVAIQEANLTTDQPSGIDLINSTFNGSNYGIYTDKPFVELDFNGSVQLVEGEKYAIVLRDCKNSPNLEDSLITQYDSTNNYVDGKKMFRLGSTGDFAVSNTSDYNFYTQITIGDFDVWMWSDYNCTSNTGWYSLQPYLDFRACAKNVDVCDADPLIEVI